MRNYNSRFSLKICSRTDILLKNKNFKLINTQEAFFLDCYQMDIMF